MYYGGPYFETEGMVGITTLATYSYNGMPAMVAFEYGGGNGRVFLTGPHPEWEEDSYRDGSLWDNDLDENGSEWDLCKTVSLWLASVVDVPSEPNPSSDLTFTIILIVVSSVAALVVLSIWSRKR
jgi:hypothetical protein